VFSFKLHVLGRHFALLLYCHACLSTSSIAQRKSMVSGA